MMSSEAVTSSIVKTTLTRGRKSWATAIEHQTALMQATTKKPSTARLVRSRKNMSAMRGV